MEDNGGELAQRVGTRCGQLGSLLRERRETLCPLEADHEQVGSVVPCEVEGTSAANGCTRSLGGIETPGALEVARIPSVSVPVCMVMSATPCVSETPCVEATPCASGVVTSVPECLLPSTPCVKGHRKRKRPRVCRERHACVNSRVGVRHGV